MSDRKMTDAHVALIDGLYPGIRPPYRETAREILAVIKGLASGELRCADTKTEVVVKRGELESLRRAAQFIVEAKPSEPDTNAWNRFIDLLDRWLSTPDLPQK